MLKIASNKKIYKMLFNLDLNNISNFEKRYDAIVAAGVISPAHANPDTISNSYSILNNKGLMIFSINDHALNDNFFFNEINRARPQVHSLMLRAMAERSVTAFNKEYRFPHLQVFADRNRIEKEETFEISSAAKDRFLMEISIETPKDNLIQKELIFNNKFYDVDSLIQNVPSAVVPYSELNDIAQNIQESVKESEPMRDYAIRLWTALRDPKTLGVKDIDGLDVNKLVESGASPRGMAMLIRAAKVNAWLAGRLDLIPEDLHGGLQETMAHRIVL